MDFPEKVMRRRTRIFIHSLIVSGTLNIALIATFVTTVLTEDKRLAAPATVETRLEPAPPTYQRILRRFIGIPYDELVRALYDETHIEQGQRRCDLALAFLGAYHHFDVERALAGYPVEKRVTVSEGGDEITLYPGLSAGKLEAVRRFARTEVWPLTPEGLFREIERRTEIPHSLKQAFENTTEYFLIRRALNRLPYRIDEASLFSFITDGSWTEIEVLADRIRNNPDGKIVELTPFLIPRLDRGSELAAYLLVLLDRDYALKRLDDPRLERLLSLLTEKTPEIETFLAEIRASLRSNRIRRLADKSSESPPRRHTVQAGDSLWKIARDYGVTTKSIEEMNPLRSESLKPGTTLLLPPEPFPEKRRPA
ncbi:MAG: LysM peptidoglycan-binding domain-containing protein [Chlamydiota bacterium]